MGNILYLECCSGISGDMTAAALLDLGADRAVLSKALQSLPLQGFHTKISRVKKAGLDACDFNVILHQDNHDHDMEYLHGSHIHSGFHTHVSNQNQNDSNCGQNENNTCFSRNKHCTSRHSHDEQNISHHDRHKHHSHDGQNISYHDHHEHHSHDEQNISLHDHHEHHSHEHMPHNDRCHNEHDHHHDHRPLSEIISMIQQADITDCAKQTASNIFQILGESEAKAHGVSIEDVHFHEVGAVDSIVDIISAAVCLDNLNITEVIIPVLYEGCGTIRCQHGILPVPVPAVVNIIQKYNLPLHITCSQGEFVTPTGAAIAAAVCTGNKLPDQFRILRTGLGAGKRTYDRPSLLRAMLIEPCCDLDLPAFTQNTDFIYKLETNIDDCTGEAMGSVLGQLMDAGAKDVHYIPVYMKKNRPAYQLNVLCEEDDLSKLEQIIFSQTTTIGIRRQRMQRSILPREPKTIQTEYGEVRVKVCRINQQMRIYPEYDSISRLCIKENCSYMEMYCKIQETCRKQLLGF